MSKGEKEAKWKELMKESLLDNYGKTAGSLRRLIENTHYVPVLDWASLVASLYQKMKTTIHLVILTVGF